MDLFDLIWGILAGVIFVLLVAFVQFGISPKSAYRKRADFLTPSERSFFGVLESILPSNYRAFAKPRLADIIEPTAVSRKRWRAAFNRISSKHVDFVVLDSSTMDVVAAIELDDSSHRRKSSRRPDAFKDQSFASSGIPLLRVRAAKSYNAAELRSQLEAQFSDKNSLPKIRS